jgi:predicted anti-sigma-YlaC factor YlaD
MTHHLTGSDDEPISGLAGNAPAQPSIGTDGTTSCADVRLTLSARLDGEDPLLPSEAIGRHLDGCVSCGAWLVGAQRVEEVMRSAGRIAPDLSALVLASVAADRARSAAGSLPVAAGPVTRPALTLPTLLRWCIGLIAVAQLISAVPILVGILVGDAHGLHASREMASFDVAMAVGFLLAALRPAQARTFMPVAFILAACLAMTSTIDLINGTTLFIHEVSHLVAIAQGVMLWLLGRSSLGGGELEEPGYPPSALPAR